MLQRKGPTFWYAAATLEKESPMYYEYWNLNRPPFDNVPDPSMYVDSHASVENAIAETIFAIEEGNECIAVIVGDVGLGKTLSLRMIIDSLDHEKYRIAFVTNPDMSFVQLLREILGQLTGRQCEIRKKVDLLETFNRLLFTTLDEGKKILIVIDEANAMSPANLESLRLLTNMQEDNRNLFTIVLAGQIELAMRLEHPKRANLFQRIGTYNKLDKIESEDLTRNYVETRLKLAGSGQAKIFTDGAIGLIWAYSEFGIPRLINKICKLSLKAGETNGLRQIEGDVVRQVGERFQRLSGPMIQKRRPRPRVPESCQERTYDSRDRVMAPDASDRPDGLETFATHVRVKTSQKLGLPEPNPEPIESASNGSVDIRINGLAISVDIPEHVFLNGQSYSEEYRVKLAGVLAAQTMEKYPQLTASHGTDPVTVWHEIRDVVLGALAQQKKVV
jgi:type II secretory pathway predicted ATPase ExeA